MSLTIECGWRASAGVIHQNVHLTKFLLDPLNDRLDVALLANVTLQRVNLPAVSSLPLVRPFLRIKIDKKNNHTSKNYPTLVFSKFLATGTTMTPFSASFRAISAPIPSLAPVTIATFPCQRSMLNDK